MTVIGVYSTKSEWRLLGDSSIHIPFMTSRKLYNMGDNIGWMVIAAHDDADIKKVEEDVKVLLKKYTQNAIPTIHGPLVPLILDVWQDYFFVKGIKFLTVFVGIATSLLA
ncbi:MAG: hypothetical protein U5K51_15560 [Flavobacteriaceae bacterium]|nr:hypothetical protein [Flavobacteriaceae bacterium]